MKSPGLFKLFHQAYLLSLFEGSLPIFPYLTSYSVVSPLDADFLESLSCSIPSTATRPIYNSSFSFYQYPVGFSLDKFTPPDFSLTLDNIVNSSTFDLIFFRSLIMA